MGRYDFLPCISYYLGYIKNLDLTAAVSVFF